MRLLYDAGLRFYRFIIFCASISGNEKAKQWLTGRKNWELALRHAFDKQPENVIWFHCASLGEFEQGRPVLEKIKSNYPSHFILLTFFSPSGYEIRKNYSVADHICYLPLDGKDTVKKFIRIVNPLAVYFVKYEFWYHYTKELSDRNIPFFFISSHFRKNQIFFKPYGSFFKKMLERATLLLVQNEQSAQLLRNAGMNNYKITGDTRFDRVKSIVHDQKTLPLISAFKGTKTILIGGSTWEEDEEILLKVFAELNSEVKLILVPHDVSPLRIKALTLQAKSILKEEVITVYSSMNEQARVLIVDTIGILSSLYSYSSIAWIGGGFGAGIHNTLEAAAYSIPVVFGPKYHKFNEAVELINIGGGFSAQNYTDVKDVISNLLADSAQRTTAGRLAGEYVMKNAGATEKTIQFTRSYLQKQ